MPSPEGSTVTFRRVPAGIRPAAIRRFARILETEVARGRTFDCLITGDAELRRLNRDFRSKDYATDVLSFPAAVEQASWPATPAPSPPRRGTKTVAVAGRKARLPVRLGDIAISLARAREQARRLGHSTEDEIRILMLHGALHLIGMDHETDTGQMARAERRWQARLRLPGGLIERAAL